MPIGHYSRRWRKIHFPTNQPRERTTILNNNSKNGRLYELNKVDSLAATVEITARKMNKFFDTMGKGKEVRVSEREVNLEDVKDFEYNKFNNNHKWERLTNRYFNCQNTEYSKP